MSINSNFGIFQNFGVNICPVCKNPTKQVSFKHRVCMNETHRVGIRYLSTVRTLTVLIDDLDEDGIEFFCELKPYEEKCKLQLSEEKVYEIKTEITPAFNFQFKSIEQIYNYFQSMKQSVLFL